MRLFKLGTIFTLTLTAACATTQPEKPKVEYSMDDIVYITEYETAAGTSAAKTKLGSAYNINDEWYYPAHEPSYNKEGKASWYGPGLEGNKTASGEIFSSKELTAAHPTLPIPSIVEVTNLDNGKIVNLRVNDRGPFHSKRIIDVSKAAAAELDMLKTGTANVRVRLLADETLDYLQYAGNE